MFVITLRVIDVYSVTVSR